MEIFGDLDPDPYNKSYGSTSLMLISSYSVCRRDSLDPDVIKKGGLQLNPDEGVPRGRVKLLIQVAWLTQQRAICLFGQSRLWTYCK